MARSKFFAVLIVLAVMVSMAPSVFARGRMYNASIGRFMQRDPLGTAIAPAQIATARPSITRNISASRFTQRDPHPGMQYADGMNLYQYVGSKPIGSFDPSGFHKVSLIFGAFISSRFGDWLPQPGAIHPWEIKTDQRGFGGGSFRVFGRITFDTKDLGSITRRNINIGGGSFLTIRRRLTASGTYVYEQRKAMSSVIFGHRNSGPIETTFKISGHGYYPFAPRAGRPFAALDFNMNIRVKCIAGSLFEIELDGWHDAFPDYEALIKPVGFPLTLLYGYQSHAPGPSAWPSSVGIGGNVKVKLKETFDLFS